MGVFAHVEVVRITVQSYGILKSDAVERVLPTPSTLSLPPSTLPLPPLRPHPQQTHQTRLPPTDPYSSTNSSNHRSHVARTSARNRLPWNLAPKLQIFLQPLLPLNDNIWSPGDVSPRTGYNHALSHRQSQNHQLRSMAAQNTHHFSTDASPSTRYTTTGISPHSSHLFHRGAILPLGSSCLHRPSVRGRRKA